jgi:citrate lyase gamma subunit
MSTPALPPSQPTNPTPTQAEIEYHSLKEHFETLVKWSSIAISTLIVVAGALFYNSVEGARKDASQAIQATRESADREIFAIQRSATETAKAEAQKAIDAAFEKQNVQRMIENTTQKKVDAAVEAAVQKNLGARIEAFKSLLNEIGEISNHGAQLRLAFRSGLDYLVKAKQSPDPTVRAYASSTLTEIAADYERTATQRAAAFNPQNKPDFFLLPFAPTPKALMNVIRYTPDALAPDTIASAFLDMKKRVGWDVPMFDITAAEKWCAQHKPKCEE